MIISGIKGDLEIIKESSQDPKIGRGKIPELDFARFNPALGKNPPSPGTSSENKILVQGNGQLGLFFRHRLIRLKGHRRSLRLFHFIIITYFQDYVKQVKILSTKGVATNPLISLRIIFYVISIKCIIIFIHPLL